VTRRFYLSDTDVRLIPIKSNCRRLELKLTLTLRIKDMRRTAVVHTRLAGHMARVDAARAGGHGIQILTMGQMAARLAGGFLAPIDPDSLRDAAREALPETDLGELENIKTLPGMVRAAVSTFDKVWRADIDLSSSSHPRLRGLAALERKVLHRLPPSMKKPRALVDLACARMHMRQPFWGPSRSTAIAKWQCAGGRCSDLSQRLFRSLGLPARDRCRIG
jgi:hypothetical protein